MSEIKQTCDAAVKAACSAGTSISGPCQRERDGTVEQCPNVQPMECGHTRAYLRWAPSQFSQTATWCAACDSMARAEVGEEDENDAA